MLIEKYCLGTNGWIKVVFYFSKSFDLGLVSSLNIDPEYMGWDYIVLSGSYYTISYLG